MSRTATTRWKAVRLAVFDRDGWRCCACGGPGRLECDHVDPLQRGGDPFDMDNLQTLCRGCHIAKTRRENGERRDRTMTDADREWRALVDELRG